MSAAIGLAPGRPVRSTLGRNHELADILKIVIPFLVITLAALAAKPALLRVLFPATVCLCGYWIYKRNECYYLSFAMWIVMLTPLLRRLVDYKSSYQFQSLVLLAPLLVIWLPMVDLRRRLAMSAPMVRTAMLLTVSGVVFGAGIGVIKHPNLSSSIILSAVMWVGPMVLCVFAASVTDRERLARVLTTTIAWGVLVMSAYGIYQFVVAPPWDTYWLREVNIGNFSPSFGHPEPYGIRVWSTMNSPGAFALFLSACLIWLATRKGLMVAIANMTGYIALLLTLVRTAWMMTALGLLLCALTWRKKPSLKSAAGGILTVGLIGCGLLYATQFPKVQDRLKTFTSLKSDRSVGERKLMYRFMEKYALSTPLGDGLQSPAEYHGYLLDSTFAELFFMLGWIGGICYAAGLGYLLLLMVMSLRRVSGTQAGAVVVTLAIVSQAISGDILYRQGGVVLWLFIGIWASFVSRPGSLHARSRFSFAERVLTPERLPTPAI
jgi:hypothetical protein